MAKNKKLEKGVTTDEGVGEDYVHSVTQPETSDVNQVLTLLGSAASVGGLDAMQNFFDGLPVAVYVCEAPSGAITFYNEHAVSLWGRTPNLGENYERFRESFRLFRPDGAPLPHDQSPMAVALRDGHSFRNEEVIIEWPDGRRINMLLNIDPIHDTTGRVVGTINTSHDITRLRQAEEAKARLAAIVETSDDAIVSKSLDGIIQTWNAAAERIFGYSAAEVVGQPINLIIPPELQHEERMILERLRQGERIEHYETVRISKKGRRIDISLTVSPVRNANGQIIGASKVARDISARKRVESALKVKEAELELIAETLEERVKERTKQVRQLASELITAEQSVRQHIAHLLHDDLQQMLFAVELQLGFLRDDVGKQDKFDEVVEIIHQALTLTQRLAVELSPPVLEGEGLHEPLSWLVQHMADAYQLKVIVEASDTLPTVSEDQRILLYHIVRELLFNVVKHAEVQEARVTLQAKEDGLTVTVCDHGRGFDLATLTARRLGHFGLRSVNERLLLFGGQFDIDSQPGMGTRVTLYLPSEQPSRERRTAE